METCISRDNDDFYQPCEYNEDSEIPFAPDGNAPLICDCVEKVKGTSGHFSGLKCVRKTIITPSEAGTQDIKKRKMAQEAKILHYARHHHVIRLIHTYFESGNEEQTKFAVIMDRADGNLHEYLRPGKIPSSQWFGCLISAILHIHTLDIRHRDIKPSNILIKGQKVLFADFGHENSAPEVDNGSTRGRSADIFSLGAVFLEMLVALAHPNGYKDLSEVLKSRSQQNPSYAKNIGKIHEWMDENLHLVGWQGSFLSACQRMLYYDRTRRPVAEELVSLWESLSASDERLACRCERDATISDGKKLAKACISGSEGDVKRLLKVGADPNSMSAIHHAAARGAKNIVQALLDGGTCIDILNPVGQTALHCSARNGHGDVVKQLLDNGANVDAEDENNQTALQGAAGHGYKNIVKMLLEANADIYAEDLDGDTAFHFAARREHLDILELLENH
ncbi:hypothetical protein N7448_011221 [Penicillium atrosanguineum]|nr:hypothetical protein N7448_011221 [Penicillium atrosanguineum]